MSDVPATQRVAAERLADWLADAGARTRALTGDFTGDRLLGPELDIVNPPLWEVGHVGFFHDYFALRALHGLPAYQRPFAARFYDSSAVEHAERWRLPLPPWEETWAYVDDVRAAMLARLPDGGTASEAVSYAYQLSLLHEDMHGEAFIYTRQTLADPPPPLPGEAPVMPGGGPCPGDVLVPACTHRLGSDPDVPFRFDNEKPAHDVHVPAFAIARAPVTNAEFAAFVEDGGYQRPDCWSAEGWRWREAQGLEQPRYWRREADGDWWAVRWFDRWHPLAPDHPVSHVSFWEAEAWCRWAGRRLPTEAEWEVAASRVPDDNGRSLRPGKRLWPWGETPPEPRHANLDGERLETVDVGAFPDGDSALGCRQMIGNVWEWTASRFGPFPGFRADWYRDYSEPWFAEGRYVLRGGSWATRARLIHTAHRNFFTPERNDVPTGFRTCAR